MDRVTVRETPNGVVTKHVVRRDGVRRVVIHRPDGTTVIRRTGERYGYGEHHWRDHDGVRMHRTVVIRRHDISPRHVVLREGYRHHRPDTIVNRRVTVIHNAG